MTAWGHLGCSTEDSPFCLHPSKTQEELEAQVTLVENLRKYVGEQVPPEVQSQAWEPERKELLDTVQVRMGWPGGESTAPREGCLRAQTAHCLGVAWRLTGMLFRPAPEGGPR